MLMFYRECFRVAISRSKSSVASNRLHASLRAAVTDHILLCNVATAMLPLRRHCRHALTPAASHQPSPGSVTIMPAMSL